MKEKALKDGVDLLLVDSGSFLDLHVCQFWRRVIYFLQAMFIRVLG